MVGFLPGFAYLGGLPPELELPRRENPRLKVEAGSIAIAMAMSVIYSIESPGGWNILGRTDARLWDPMREPPNLFSPGDEIEIAPSTVILSRADGEGPHNGSSASALLTACSSNDAVMFSNEGTTNASP